MFVDTDTNELVAIKQLFIRQESSRERVQNVRRELEVLSKLDHPHILCPRMIMEKAPSAWVVMDLMQLDVAAMVERSPALLPEGCVKIIARQLLEGLAYLHDTAHILHRDIKPANIMIDMVGSVRIGDFGLARFMHGARGGSGSGGAGFVYTNQIASRWYRPPEILYGADTYGPAVDMWAAGCVIAELVELSPLAPGATDIEQLALLTSIFGTPNTAAWPEVTRLPDFGKLLFDVTAPQGLDSCLPNASPALLDLVSQLLVYNPAKRLTAAQALAHPWFSAADPAREWQAGELASYCAALVPREMEERFDAAEAYDLAEKTAVMLATATSPAP